MAAKARVAETTCYLLGDALAWTGGAWEAVDATGRAVAFWETVWSSSRPTTAGSDAQATNAPPPELGKTAKTGRAKYRRYVLG